MNTQLFVNRTMAFMGPVMTLIMYGVTVMIEWFGAKSINAGHMQIGDMIAFSSYASMIIMAFMMITIVAVMLPRAEVSAARVDEILHTRPSVRAPRSAEPAPTDATVTFEHVSFRYPGAEDDVLHDVSFTARPGQVTAIVGSTGCGKSTLLNLIPRFYDATGGTVSIGGVYGACTLDPGIRQADKLLYQAKECRNKCITAAFSAEEAEKPKPNQESDKL